MFQISKTGLFDLNRARFHTDVLHGLLPMSKKKHTHTQRTIEEVMKARLGFVVVDREYTKLCATSPLNTLKKKTRNSVVIIILGWGLYRVFFYLFYFIYLYFLLVMFFVGVFVCLLGFFLFFFRGVAFYTYFDC